MKNSLAAHVFNTKKQSNIPWQTSHLGHCGHWAASREKGKTEKNCVVCVYHFLFLQFLICMSGNVNYSSSFKFTTGLRYCIVISLNCA